TAPDLERTFDPDAEVVERGQGLHTRVTPLDDYDPAHRDDPPLGHGIRGRVIPLVSGDLVTAERQQDAAAQPPPVDAGGPPSRRLDALSQPFGRWQREVQHLDHVEPGV